LVPDYQHGTGYEGIRFFTSDPWGGSLLVLIGGLQAIQKNLLV